MRSIKFIATIFLFAMTVIGCGAQPGKTVQTYTRGKTPPPMTTAETGGAYAIYASNGLNPITTVHLNEGDQYGFVKHDDGKVFAVAKGQEIALENRLATAYYW